MRPISLPICFIRNVLLLSCLLVTSMVANAQFVISYPGAAQQDLTVCYGQSTLTVRVDVAAASSNNTVTVQLPTGVNYVAGTVTKTGGTAALTIAESNIANLNAPVFAISPTALSPGDYITFTIARTAGCAARTYALAGNTFKDVTTATGSGGTKAFTPATGYNVNYPSFSLVQPAAITNAVIGATYTRTFTVTNGSSGTTGHVYLYIDYPSAGVALQSLKIGATTITPVSTVGDRTLFDISGALLGADNLFTNGEILTFAEEIKVLKCGATTAYGAGWGCDATPANWCQSATGSSAMTMATGTSDLGNRTVTDGPYVNMCTPLVRTYTVTNTGTGNASAAAMYDLKVRIYDDGYGFFNPVSYILSDINVGGIAVAATNYSFITNYQTGGLIIDFNNLIPVGAGNPLDGPSGLADTDGDGFYDDLPAGSSLAITWTQQFICSRPCGTNVLESYLAYDANFHTMCDKSTYVTRKLQGQGALSSAHSSTEIAFASQSYIPANVTGGAPFTISLAAGWIANYSTYSTANTRYRWTFTLPAGFSVAGTGNATYNGLPVNPADLVINGSTVAYTFNYTQIANELFTRPFKIDLVYTCPVNPCDIAEVGAIPYTLYKINDITSSPECACMGQKVCGTLSTNIFCPSAGCVAGGPSTDIPQIRRVDASLGWTDKTLTTRQIAANISDYDLRKAIYLDTLQFSSTATQRSVASDNLHLYMSLTRTALSEDKLQALTQSYVEVWRGGTKLTGGMFATPVSATASTATLQVIDWDLTAALPPGGLQPDDVVKTITKAFVRINIPHDIDKQTGVNWHYYNQLPAAVTYNNCGTQVTTDKLSCNAVVPEMYITGYTTYSNLYYGTPSTGCNNLNMDLNITSSFAPGNKQYASEIRPMMHVNTVDLEIPEGYDFVSATGQNNITGVTYSGLTPSSITGRIYRFTNPCGSIPLMLTILNSLSGTMYITVKPTCSVPANAEFKVTTEVSNQQYVYYPNAALPKYSAIYNHSQNVAYNQTTRPTITLTNQTGTIQAYQPQHNWTVRMANPSSSTAPYTWLAIPTKAGVNVISVTDVATGTALTPTIYSGGNWYQISTTGLAAGTFKDYKIDFTYTSCNKDSLQVLGGWNCSGFPTDPTTYTCGNNALWLKFIPEVSEVELTADALPPAKVDLCTLVDYAFHITSSQAANTVHNKVVIDFPTGMHAVQGSFFVEYPLGAGNWKEITPNVGAATPQGIKYTYDLTSATDIYPAQGLPGTLATSVTANRQMGIKFKTTTDCSFVANTNFNISALADRPCGEPAIGNGLIVQGPSVGINGVNPAYQTINVLTSTDMLNCSQEATITVQSTIIAGTTGANDIMNILLPKGISMVPNSFIQINGGTVTFVSASTDPATGVTVIKYKIPSGLTSGDKMEFSIKVIDGVDSNCGVNRVDVQTKAIFENITCGSSTCPTVGAETGRGGVDFNVKKPDLTLTAVSGCHNAASGGYNVAFTVSNSGTAALLSTGDPLVMKFYCNDGSGNPTGTALATYSQAVDVAIAGTNSGTYSFTSSTACANGVIAVISKDDNCICNTTQKAFAPGAGPATPTVTTTAATCSAAGTATISNYNSAYTYTFSPTGPSVGTGGAITGMTAGTSYTVTAASGTCVSSASASFSVAAQLAGTSLSLSPATQTVCAGQTASVSATVSGGASVNWVSDLGGMTATGNNFTTGALPNKGTLPYTITVTATASNGTCPISEQATITVMPEPRIVISPKSKMVCVKEKVQFSISAIIPGTVISWTLINSANATLSTGTGIDTATAAVSGLAAGVYTLKVTATKGSCSSQATASLVVN